MLIDFTVSNFRSIKEPQTLSMLATSAKENPENIFTPNEKEPEIKLLKTAAIYGANASGKSNIIKALDTMWYFVRNSTNFKRGEKIDYYYPFKLDVSYTTKPTSFEMEFVGADEVRYRYGFSYNREEILKEFLFFYPKKQEAKLFIREKGKAIEFGESLKGAKKSIESLLLPNNLFLSKAANNNHQQLGEIYEYIIYGFYIIGSSYSYKLNNIVSKMLDEYKNDNLKENINKLIGVADIGIEEIITKEKKDDNENINDGNKVYDIQSVHRLFDDKNELGTIEFNIEEESEGTQRLYGLGGAILDLMSLTRTIIIDEFNNSFHPLMSEFLIKLFYNQEINPDNSQLIFATHDTSILKPELFRRDQIWFTEKDKYGATSLYSLSEFDYDKVRATIPFDKWYLSGRFGALPLIKEFQFTEDAKAEKGE